ncbi:lysophospholipid acyltransferase family protein [Hoyosella subflava]|uniref:Putative acyltransferase n=1 Tax=Hoyosella subflava (strain DSM 45089 / JCM 17490 / NBRC 109087 / DQS3-9A1) TaxID=443218 RepID=F6EFD7_HOYSD|nr:lysophospholipid acyltransferase family protein [Hoyosella subflava]AEF39750.1 Putative acyltransferase [Hoyosella subflava DQS3-9A1]
MWYWLFKYILIGPLLYLIGRPTIEGAEHIPAKGGAILASNHLAVADSLYLPLMVRRRITFLAKSEYFTTPGIKGKLLKFFYAGSGQVPIDRASGAAAEAALHTGRRILSEGKLLGLYPEGTRSPDGRLFKGKTGIARLALETGTPIIPVAMIGTEKVNPPGSKMWKPAKVRIRIGKPLDFSRFDGMRGTRFVERAITDEVLYELMNLSGQEYVDIYAATYKADKAANKTKPGEVSPVSPPEPKADTQPGASAAAS